MAKRAVSKFVTVDDTKKYVFCDMDNAPQGAISTVGMYVAQGYKLNPSLRSGDARKKADYLAMCQTEAQKKKFEAICKGKELVNGKKGFFAAKKWLLEELGE